MQHQQHACSPALVACHPASGRRSWVAEQAAAAPKELWTDGVEDYLKYAKQLLSDYKNVLERWVASPALLCCVADSQPKDEAVGWLGRGVRGSEP